MDSAPIAGTSSNQPETLKRSQRKKKVVSKDFMVAAEEQVSPTLRLTLPAKMTAYQSRLKSIYINIPLYEKDYELSWSQYFIKHGKGPMQDMYNKILQANDHRTWKIVDRRGIDAGRKAWTLQNTVKEFVESFAQNRRLYTADLKLFSSNNFARSETFHEFKKPAPVPRQNCFRKSVRNQCLPLPSPAPGLSRPVYVQNREKCLPLPDPTPGPSGAVYAESRKNNHFPAVNQRPFSLSQKLNIPRPDLDTSSVADSVWSQDSMSDLTSLGIPIIELKSKICTRFAQRTSNPTMLRMAHELKTLKNDNEGKLWMQLVRKIPQTILLWSDLFSNNVID